MPRRPPRRAQLACALAATALAAAGCGSSAARHAGDHAGRRVFLSAGCGACHALKAAGTQGGVGPDLDSSERLSRAVIRRQITLGIGGMPSYAGRLTPSQMDAVARFVYDSTH
jgi:mono/diheme cytochrome c family protein